jgi:hypothetical protein
MAEGTTTSGTSSDPPGSIGGPTMEQRIAFYHEHLRLDAAAANESAGMAVDLAQSAVKGATLINGGAAVALLAYLGSQAAQSHQATWAAQALGYFAVGTAVAVLAGACAYVTQFLYLNSIGSSVHVQRDLFPDHSAVPEWDRFIAKQARFQFFGRMVNMVAIAVFLCSIGLFLMGVSKAYHGFAARMSAPLTAATPQASTPPQRASSP